MAFADKKAARINTDFHFSNCLGDLQSDYDSLRQTFTLHVRVTARPGDENLRKWLGGNL
jgi:hypothetical protein